MLNVTTLASGSEGNCMLITGGGAAVLIDAGVSCRRIFTSLRQLGMDPAGLDGILITHEHSDHIRGLATLTGKLTCPVYASPGTARQLEWRVAFPEGMLRPVPPGTAFSVGALTIRSFPTSHDAAESVGYRVTCGHGSLALATDLGTVTPAVLDGVLGCDTVVVETNHDVELLRAGPYPYPLKQRILGERGHLCNEAGAELAARAVQAGAGTLILAHLSRQNNTPAHALAAVRRAVARLGLNPDRDVTITVAPRSEVGPTFSCEGITAADLAEPGYGKEGATC